MKTIKQIEQIMKRIFALSIISILILSCGSNVSQEDQKLADRKFLTSIDFINEANYKSAIDTLNSLIDKGLFVSKAKLLKAGALLALNETYEAWDVYISRFDFVMKSKVNLEVNKWPTPPPKTVSSNFFIMLNKKKKICDAILEYDFEKDIPIIKEIRDETIKTYNESSKLP